jgi:hypothetical protein
MYGPSTPSRKSFISNVFNTGTKNSSGAKLVVVAIFFRQTSFQGLQIFFEIILELTRHGANG